MSSQPTGPSTTSTTTTTTLTSSSTATSKPPVTLPASTHLDSGAYVRGTHAITLGEHNLIHARAQLVAIHGPLIIDDRCIISEKCIIGGPVPSSQLSSSTTNTADTKASPLLTPPAIRSDSNRNGDDDDEEEEPDPVKTLIGQSVYLHAGSHVHAGATIQNAVILEPNVSILAGVTIGAHSKICAGLTIDHDVDPWTVVLGNGDVHRPRRQPRQRRPKAGLPTGSSDTNAQSEVLGSNGETSRHIEPDGDEEEGDEDPAELIERLRLTAMDKEREGTVAIYRTAQRLASLAKKK
jgi:acetyltransferase-like isoleucine patch superfamily enzyme